MTRLARIVFLMLTFPFAVVGSFAALGWAIASTGLHVGWNGMIGALNRIAKESR